MESYKKIKGFETACKALNRKPILPSVVGLPEKHKQYVISNYIIVTVVEAINLKEDGTPWEPNYNDSNESKYELRFWIKADDKRPGGFGFSLTHCDVWSADAGAGSRLCFQSYEKMMHAYNILSKHYQQQILTLKPTKKLITK